jgi:hypothetical protein
VEVVLEPGSKGRDSGGPQTASFGGQEGQETGREEDQEAQGWWRAILSKATTVSQQDQALVPGPSALPYSYCQLTEDPQTCQEVRHQVATQRYHTTGS